MLKYAILLALLAVAYAENKAHVKLVIVDQGVSGDITFTSKEDSVLVEGEIKGLKPGKHGFHVHEKGDLSDGCKSTGGHFNPEQKNHGAPDAKERHVGDLGNIVADANGIAKVQIVDKKIALTGENCIIGRAIVVHEDQDDLGLGGQNDSLTTGHAGNRVGCGIIGIVSSAYVHTAISSLILFALGWILVNIS